MVELGTHNLCPLTNEVEECILGARVFKTGIMRSRSYKNVLALLHIIRTAFLVRLATPRPPNRNAHTVKGSLGKVIMALPQHDEVSRNSLVRFSSLPINSDSFTFILANTTNSVRFS